MSGQTSQRSIGGSITSISCTAIHSIHHHILLEVRCFTFVSCAIIFAYCYCLHWNVRMEMLSLFLWRCLFHYKLPYSLVSLIEIHSEWIYSNLMEWESNLRIVLGSVTTRYNVTTRRSIIEIAGEISISLQTSIESEILIPGHQSFSCEFFFLFNHYKLFCV